MPQVNSTKHADSLNHQGLNAIKKCLKVVLFQPFLKMTESPDLTFAVIQMNKVIYYIQVLCGLVLPQNLWIKFVTTRAKILESEKSQSSSRLQCKNQIVAIIEALRTNHKTVEITTEFHCSKYRTSKRQVEAIA